VPEKDYGLGDEELLLLDDKQLNRMVSLKKIQPYRDDQDLDNHVNLHKVRQLKTNLKRDLQHKEKLFKEELERELELEKQKHLKGYGKDKTTYDKEDRKQSKNKKRKAQKELNPEEVEGEEEQ